jgi:hypothetical protein
MRKSPVHVPARKMGAAGFPRQCFVLKAERGGQLHDQS